MGPVHREGASEKKSKRNASSVWCVGEPGQDCLAVEVFTFSG